MVFRVVGVTYMQTLLALIPSFRSVPSIRVHRVRLGRSVLRQMPHAVPTAPLIKMLSAATMPWFADAIERILWRIFREDGQDFLAYSWRFAVLEWAFVFTVVMVTGLLAVTLATLLARTFPTVRDLWLALGGLTMCTVPATVVVGSFFVLQHTAADAWPSTIVFIVALLLGSCSLRLTLTNQQKAGVTEELDDMSDVTSTTNTPQLRADFFSSAPEVDNRFMFDMASEASSWSV